MQWQKQGRIYNPDGTLWWAKSYAHLPTAYVMDDAIRVYYTGLDENKYGRIGYIDLDKNNPSNILYIAPEPVLDLGELGTFDDCGTVPSCIIERDNKIYLYYIGFQRTERVPYMLFSGLAISEDGINFERYSRTPILDRTPDEPFLRSAPTILCEDDVYKMWYVSARKWTSIHNQLYPKYIIRYATSNDAINWQVSDSPSIDFNDEAEFGFGRPWITKEDNQYVLWYSIRSETHPYRIGKAISDDGLNWERIDNQVTIKASDDGWDSEMICYSNIIQINNQSVMFYNGNQHGRTGFGYATLQS